MSSFRRSTSCFRIVLILALTALAGTAYASYRLFDDLEDEVLGPVGGQDGWISGGGDNQIVIDPADLDNQTLYVPSASSTLRKSLLEEDVSVPDGTVRMMFMRIRLGNKQTFSVGLSGMSGPREYSDFATEIGMANSAQNLDLRAWDEDGAKYEMLTELAREEDVTGVHRRALTEIQRAADATGAAGFEWNRGQPEIGAGVSCMRQFVPDSFQLFFVSCPPASPGIDVPLVRQRSVVTSL